MAVAKDCHVIMTLLLLRAGLAAAVEDRPDWLVLGQAVVAVAGRCCCKLLLVEQAAYARGLVAARAVRLAGTATAMQQMTMMTT
jgi:hypothetical protein